MANPFSKIINFFKKSYWTRLGSVLFGETPFQPTNRDYLDSYEASFLVNICVRKIAEKVANTKFKLYKITGKEKIMEVNNHPLLDLLAQVNPFVTKFEMMDNTQTYIELLGNSYWLKVRGKTSKKPLELWQLRPDWVKIIEDPEKIIKEYQYRLPNGTTQTFQPEDVIQFKQPNPKSALYGLPTVKAAIDVIRTSIYTTRWNMNFFYNQARPDTLVIVKNKMQPEAKKEFKKQWEEEYGGLEKAHKFGLLEGEDVDIKQLNLTMRDMEFSKLRESTTQDILAAFGVPKAIIGLQGMNRAEAEAQIYVFLSETIEPKIRRIVERLNEFLVPEYGDNLYLDFVDPTPENREAKTKEYESALKNNWMLINEVRDLENLPPIEGGWNFYLPIAMMPAGGLKKNDIKNLTIKGIEPKKYYEIKEQKSQEALRKKILTGKRKLKLKLQLKKELIKMFIRKPKEKMTKEGRKAYWREHDKMLTGDGKLFAVLTRKLLKKQEERMQEALASEFESRALTKGKYDLVNWEIEDKVFFELSVPVFTDIIERRGKRAATLIGAEEFALTDRVKKFIDKKAFKFAYEVNDTTKKKLRKTLTEGVKEGEGVKELSKRVADTFNVRRGAETERIARTEVLSASNGADLEAYNQSGVVEKKEWLTTMDDRTRDWHAMMDGEVVGINKKFSNGLMFPGDPSAPADEIINCRCTTLPVIEA